MTISIPVTANTLADRIALIEALDLEPIKFKASRQEDGYGWSAAHAERVAVAYKRYLTLCLKYPTLTIAPDQDTDRFWHMHILDTRKYAADCEQVFGYFLHHFPYLGLRGADDAQALDDAFAKTQQLALEEFGEPMLGAAAAWCAAEGAATPKAAWCAAQGQAPQAKAAWCAAEGTAVSGKAAWCAAEAKAAWCAAETKAAWCAADGKAAWCAAEGLGVAPKAAWCAAEGAQPAQASAAWCAAEALPAHAAWCAAQTPSQPKAAWCAAESAAQPKAAWCAAQAPTQATTAA